MRKPRIKTFDCPFCHKKLQDTEEAEAHLMGDKMEMLCEGHSGTSTVVVVRVNATMNAYPIFFQPENQYLN